MYRCAEPSTNSKRTHMINPEGTNNYSFRLTQDTKNANQWFEILTHLDINFNSIYIIVKLFWDPYRN
jgi:hypothetical protein